MRDVKYARLGVYDYGQFYRVGFFGHRYVDKFRETEDRLEKLIKEILRKKVRKAHYKRCGLRPACLRGENLR